MIDIATASSIDKLFVYASRWEKLKGNKIMNITVGSTEVFDCGLYPETPRSFTNYLQDKVNSIASFGNGLSQSFMDMTKSLFAKHNDEAMLAAARQIALASSSLFDMNIIMYLANLEALRNAKPLMQRFIMANPEATKLLHSQQIDGYFGSFLDTEPGCVGQDRRDYRLVTDGLVRDNEDGSISWTVNYGDYEEDDVQLSFRDKNDILDAWDITLEAIARGEDFSNLTGGKIN